VEDPRGSQTPSATPADDPATVAGCRAGDPASLERFFVTHVRYVERVISRLTGPTPDLEDLVQTTFIQAFQSFGARRASRPGSRASPYTRRFTSCDRASGARCRWSW
jgi:DNA-directed RNA polymerase specialized sigma24 family protein